MDYTLKRYARSRSVRIRVEHDGEVVVSAPRFTPKRFVDAVVAKQQRWIERQKQKLKLQQTTQPLLDWKNRIVSFKGSLYSIEVANGQTELITLAGRRMLVNPPGNSESTLKKVVLQWLKQQSRKDIYRLTNTWKQRMKLTYKRIRMAQQKSRWGSSSTTGTLSFNWRLIHFPEPVMTYVVIHELAHIRHHNHSRQFWETVAEYDPEYKAHEKYLKKQRVAIEMM